MGVIEAMIRSIKDNRSVRGATKTMRDRTGDYSYENSTSLEFKDSMTAEEHAQHKAEWRLRKRKSQRKLLVILISMLVCTGAIIVYLST